MALFEGRKPIFCAISLVWYDFGDSMGDINMGVL